MLSIAETEKYAHVTYFFNGGKENIVPHEVRILIPSIAAKSYTELPCMSAPLITQAVIKSLKKNPKDFYLINYANADMVGHSGNLRSTIKAIECLDAELFKLYELVVQKLDGTLYITADHGKAEEMADSKGNPRTAHTTNLVPFMMIRKGLEQSTLELPLIQLRDIAPFILEQLGIPVPEAMKKP
jgi:2,3-bisphosphoglycerate-independent phosphoglycerate mutase